MVNGIKVSNMDMVFGEDCITILISVNGEALKPKVMEFTPGKMETDMKVNGNNV
jgi:hypothetical protein